MEKSRYPGGFPDVVGVGLRSLELSLSYLERLCGTSSRPYLPVQDGMTLADLEGLEVDLFVGGSTEWKLSTLGQWVDLAHSWGRSCHVGRVNTRKRMRLCWDAGVDSFDGSGPAMFRVHAERMTRWLQEMRDER